jgi:hypothetical protein
MRLAATADRRRRRSADVEPGRSCRPLRRFGMLVTDFRLIKAARCTANGGYLVIDAVCC